MDAEASASGAEHAAGRLAAFAADHRVAPPVRETLAAVTADLVGVLAGALGAPPAAHLRVEADIGEEDLQVVIAYDGDDRRPIAEAALRRRLIEVGARCDRFGVERVGAGGVEVWCSLALRGAPGRPSAA